MKHLYRTLTHLIFRLRSFGNSSIKKFAKGVENKIILEIGSGEKRKGKYPYSVKQFFDTSNDFIQSDIISEFGHEIIDVTEMKFQERFDIIICMNVLEHVFDVQKAILNIHTALKDNGKAIIFVPAIYPLHNEPNDYWRFTEHSLKKLMTNFRKVTIINSGVRQFPSAYFVVANK